MLACLVRSSFAVAVAVVFAFVLCSLFFCVLGWLVGCGLRCITFQCIGVAEYCLGLPTLAFPSSLSSPSLLLLLLAPLSVLFFPLSSSVLVAYLFACSVRVV